MLVLRAILNPFPPPFRRIFPVGQNTAVMDLSSFLELAGKLVGLLPRAYRWLKRRFGRWVPLTSAALVAYEEARQTQSLLADAAERLGPDKSPAGVLNYVAHYIALEVTIWGKRQPSTKLEQIDPVQARSGTFFDAGSSLRLRDRNNTVFTDLCVVRKDLGLVLHAVRTGLKADTPI